ncbi:MAG: hypothetical protein ABJA98_09880 [Acidobacteriota bacterium]
MRQRVLMWSAIAVASLLTASPPAVHAQSLADVARAEEARRKEIKQHARVYTNKDLVSVPLPVSSAPAPATAPAASDAATTGTGKPQSGTKDEKPEAEGAAAVASDAAAKNTPKDQAYWSGGMKSLLARLDQDRVLADALQSRVNALTADFSARDDPAQRASIGVARQKALDELDRLKKSTLNDQKAIADFQEEARRASVPPGWLR